VITDRTVVPFGLTVVVLSSVPHPGEQWTVCSQCPIDALLLPVSLTTWRPPFVRSGQYRSARNLNLVVVIKLQVGDRVAVEHDTIDADRVGSAFETIWIRGLLYGAAGREAGVCK